MRGLGSTRMWDRGRSATAENVLSSQRKGRDALEATQNPQRSYSTDCYSSSFCRKATAVMERRNDLLIVGRYGAGAFHQVLEDAGIQWAEGLGGAKLLAFPHQRRKLDASKISM